MRFGSDDGESAASERVDHVLADLGGQWEAAEAAALAAEVEDRTRRENALLTILDRLRASIGRPISVSTVQGSVGGELTDVGLDWILLRASPSQAAVVHLSAVVAVAGLTSAAVSAASVGQVEARLDLRYLLRAEARDRRRLRVVVLDGRAYDGVLSRCGADFLEISAHRRDEAPESGAGRSWLLPLSAVVIVHLDGVHLDKVHLDRHMD